MLNLEDNQLLTQTGPDAPMGKLFRQYWIPALVSEELATPDCAPMRLRMLGENLIAFRDTSGRVGIIANACPHRGASMFFGRNEEDGLRCVYHGWKFDTTGACVDMPSEPAESNFKNKVRARAYPCEERNGVIWCYMGPREVPPPLPLHPGNVARSEVIKSVRDCNYMQALEGDIDTIHAGFLHFGSDRHDDYPQGSDFYYMLRDRWAYMEVREFELGATYGAYKPAEEGTNCWRMGHFLLPFYTYNAPGILTLKRGGFAWVPIDDEHCMTWSIRVLPRAEDYGKPAIGGLFEAPKRAGATPSIDNPQRKLLMRDNFLPDTTDWIGKFRSRQTLENDYLIDREIQRENRLPTAGYTGILYGSEPQDRGMQESMGPIFDRSDEHLGTTDAMVIKTRRKLLDAARRFAATGETPPGVDQPELYMMYSGGAIVPESVSGLDYCRDAFYGRAMPVEVATNG